MTLSKLHSHFFRNLCPLTADRPVAPRPCPLQEENPIDRELYYEKWARQNSEKEKQRTNKYVNAFLQLKISCSIWDRNQTLLRYVSRVNGLQFAHLMTDALDDTMPVERRQAAQDLCASTFLAFCIKPDLPQPFKVIRTMMLRKIFGEDHGIGTPYEDIVASYPQALDTIAAAYLEASSVEHLSARHFGTRVSLLFLSVTHPEIAEAIAIRNMVIARKAISQHSSLRPGEEIPDSVLFYIDSYNFFSSAIRSNRKASREEVRQFMTDLMHGSYAKAIMARHGLPQLIALFLDNDRTARHARQAVRLLTEIGTGQGTPVVWRQNNALDTLNGLRSLLDPEGETRLGEQWPLLRKILEETFD